MTYEVKPATIEDYKQVVGKYPSFSIHAWAVYYKDKVISVTGIQYQPSCAVAFSAILDKTRHSKIRIWKIALEIWELMKDYEEQLVAVCEDPLGKSPAFLRRLGFTEINKEKGVYLWVQK